MAHGAVPILSDLPANHELVRSGDNGLIVGDDLAGLPAALHMLAPQAERIAAANRAWVAEHGLFAPAVAGLLARLVELS